MVEIQRSSSISIDQNVVEKKAERAEAQKKIFTKWINSRMKQSRIQVTDINQDFKDGQKLCTLLQVISGKSINGVVNKKLRTFKIQNVNKALEFLKTCKVDLCSIGAEDIVDGNEKLTLALIWNIILKFQIQESLEEVVTDQKTELDVDVSGDSSATIKEEKKLPVKVNYQTQLKKWAAGKISEYNLEITNFDTSWANGMAFCAILHKYRPELINFSSLKPEDQMRNLDLAFTTAEKHLGIFQLLDPEDFIINLDSKCVAMYVSMLYNALEKSKNVATDQSPLQVLVSTVKSNYGKMETYEKDLKHIIEWINEKIQDLNKFCYPSSLAGVDALIEETQRFCLDEFSKKLAKVMELRKIHHLLSINFQLNHQKPVFSEIHQVNQLWTKYETAFKQHQVDMGSKMKLYLELENKVDQYNKQFDQRKMWILETKALISRSISEEDLDSLEQLRIKFGLLKKEMNIFKPRVDHIVTVCEELEKNGYFDVASIKYKKFEILKLWKSLMETFEAKYQALLDKIKDVSIVKDVVFMKVWKSQIETQLSGEITATTTVELQTSLKMIEFIESNLEDYKKKCDTIIENGQVERDGITIKVEVTEELKEYLLSDVEDLFDLVNSQKEEIASRQQGQHLFQDRSQIEVWMQTADKKIPEYESKQLIESLNSALAGNPQPFMQHNVKKFKDIMKSTLGEYDKRKDQLDEMIKFCDSNQENDQEVDTSNMTKAREDLVSMKKQLLEKQFNLSSDVDSLINTIEMVVEYDQQKQQLSEIILSGSPEALEEKLDSQNVTFGDSEMSVEASTLNLNDLLNLKTANLKTSLTKLLDHLKANSEDLNALGLIKIDEAAVNLNGSFDKIILQINDQSSNLVASDILNSLKSQMESMAIWIDDRSHDLQKVQGNANSTEKVATSFNRQNMIACEGELLKLSQDSSEIANNWEKLKEIEQKIRVINIDDNDKSTLIVMFKNIKNRLSNTETQMNERKGNLEQLKYISGQFEDTSFLIMTLKQKLRILMSISKTSEISNEEIISLRKNIADHKKHAHAISEKLAEKELIFRDISKNTVFDLSAIFVKFKEVEETRLAINSKILSLEKDCKEISDVENFEISYRDFKLWLKASNRKLEEMEDIKSFNNATYTCSLAYIEEVTEEMTIRQKEYDQLELLKKKIENSPDKAKLAPFMKSFKGQKAKMKKAQGLCGKVRSILDLHAKFSSIVFAEKNMEMTIMDLENCVNVETETTVKREVDQIISKINILINKELFIDQKLKTLIDQISQTKYSGKKAASESKNNLINMRKRLAIAVKKGRKKLKHLESLANFFIHCDTLAGLKDSVNGRRDVKELYSSMQSEGTMIDFKTFCQFTRLELNQFIQSADELRDKAEKEQKKSQVGLKSLVLGIDKLQSLAKENIANITKVVNEDKSIPQENPLDTVKNLNTPENKLKTLERWQTIFKDDINNSSILIQSKPILISATPLSSTKSLKVNESPAYETSSEDILNVLLVNELRECSQMIDSEFNEFCNEFECELQEQHVSLKNDFLKNRTKLLEIARNQENSAKSQILIADLVAIAYDRIDWIKKTTQEVNTLSNTSYKEWANNLGKLKYIETNVDNFISLYQEDIIIGFSQFLSGEISDDSANRLPEVFQKSIEELQLLICNMRNQIIKNILPFRITERCEQYVRWLVIQQGFVAFVSSNSELSCDIYSMDLHAISVKDLEHIGVHDLESIEDLVKNINTISGDPSDENSKAISNENKERMNEIVLKTKEAHKHLLTFTSSMIEDDSIDSENITLWEMRQILKEYKSWNKPGDRFHVLELDQSAFDVQNQQQQQLNSKSDLFRLTVESKTMEYLQKSLQQISDPQNEESIAMKNLTDKFNENQKKSVAHADAKHSMLLSIELRDYSGDFCKFFLLRIQEKKKYMKLPEIVTLANCPTNHSILVIEMMRSECLNLRSKAEESRLLVAQMNSMMHEKDQISSYSQFLLHQTQVRNEYDALTDNITESHQRMSFQLKKYSTELNIKELIRFCHSLVYQIRIAPPPESYFDCAIRATGHNKLGDLFQEIVSDVKINLNILFSMYPNENNLAIKDEAITANSLLLAEWEMTSEIMACEMEMSEFIKNSENTVKKYQYLKSIAQSKSKDSLQSPSTHCITHEILTGYKQNMKSLNLKGEDKKVSDLLNKRAVNVDIKNDAMKSKMNKSVRKKSHAAPNKKGGKIETNSGVKQSPTSSTSNEDPGKLELCLLEDSRIRFSLTKVKDTESSRPEKNGKYLGKNQIYLLIGLYVLPEELKSMIKAREDRLISNIAVNDIDIEQSTFYPQFKLCVFKQSEKVSVANHLTFTFNLVDLSFEASCVDNVYLIDVKLKSGSTFTLELMTMQKYLNWITYFEIIKRLTSAKKT